MYVHGVRTRYLGPCRCFGATVPSHYEYVHASAVLHYHIVLRLLMPLAC